MPEETTFDLVVLGGGPGGYVAAIRAAQLGMKTACVEKEDALGGTCLRIGCIPSKALLDSSELFHQLQHKGESHGIRFAELSMDVPAMLGRKDEVVTGLTRGVAGLFKKNGIEWVRGFGRLASTETVEVETGDGKRTLRAKTILLATGSVPVELPFLKFDHERIIDSTGALSIPQVPEHLVVVGGGVIGLELGSVWLRLGAKVTVLEAMPTILPGMDKEIVKQADRIFRKQGFDVRTGTKVTGAERKGEKVTVTVEGGDPIEADYVLVAVGRARTPRGWASRRRGSGWSAASSRWTSATTRGWGTCMPSATPSAGGCWRTRRRRKGSRRLRTRPGSTVTSTTTRWRTSSTPGRRSPQWG
jgi:dihydrolipoamide dehydrogenase